MIEDNYTDFWKAWIYEQVTALTSRCAPSSYDKTFARRMFRNEHSMERKELNWVLESFLGIDSDWFADKLRRCKKDVDYVRLVKYHFGVK